MHPSVRIIALFVFAVLIYGLSGYALYLACILMLVSLFCFDFLKCRWSSFPGLAEFLKILKRVRYILLFLFIVYAFNTPGEYISSGYSIAPTYEGIVAGIEQALRLASILAGLALLLVTTDRDQLLSGLYYLARPFRYSGLDPERFAVRLWLTLYYVEHGMKTRQKNSLHQLMNMEQVLEIEATAPERIVLQRPEMRRRDILALICLTLLGAGLLCV
ncbi:MAG: hypothetical protein CVU35_00130 [Betaproteobacteria bacterium HGW-Betaproteobacteria-8]|nr:MAG: hypothetical protein CVU35_00130 [Betaproteobacteria bacterium HGW-Betaproteobacteria-8]